MCCGLFSKRDGPFHQTLVILRHSERLDHVDKNYLNTKEGKEWPFDTPLTPEGITLAKTVAVELEEIHSRVPFAMVATSPYRRCMQTAAEVANLLDLPVIIDQEMGEVWDNTMPSEAPPHRSPQQLVQLARELGIRVSNPILPEGGYKLFGKRPQAWPETVEMGHRRMIVRTETYIEQSETHKQNFIIVSHAPAVAAMLDLFQRGSCDVEKLDYCARVIATRTIDRRKVSKAEEAGKGKSAYADMWEVTAKGAEVGLNLDATEDKHLDFCNEAQEMAIKRKEKRTATDAIFDQSVKNIVKAECDRLEKINSRRSGDSGRMSGNSSN